jgi:hypothetical protein
MKLVVINSAGPMGSTVLASMVEKFGYLNLPARKRDLHGYLVGRRTLDDDHFKRRNLAIMDGMSQTVTGGGTGVLDRNSAPSVRRADPAKVEAEIPAYMQAKFGSIAELYEASNKLLADSVVYKDVAPYIGHIELPTDIELYADRAQELYDRYVQEFDEVVFFHMQRNFAGWMNSLMSQLLFARRFHWEHLLVRLSSIYRRYENYRRVTNEIPGHHVDFDELFAPNTQALATRLAGILGGEVPENLEAQQFDLYGRVVSYDKAFTKEDDRRSFISDFARGLVENTAAGKGNALSNDVLFLMSHIYRMARVRLLKADLPTT